MIKRKLKKYKDGGKAPIKRSTDEVPTRNPMPVFDPLNQSLIDYANTPQSYMRGSQPQSGWDKEVEIARNPMTAASYIVQGQRVPDNFSMGPRNNYDYAIDQVNPMGIYDAVKGLGKGMSGKGDISDAMGMFPIEGRFGKNLDKFIEKSNIESNILKNKPYELVNKSQQFNAARNNLLGEANSEIEQAKLLDRNPDQSASYIQNWLGDSKRAESQYQKELGFEPLRTQNSQHYYTLNHDNDPIGNTMSGNMGKRRAEPPGTPRVEQYPKSPVYTKDNVDKGFEIYKNHSTGEPAYQQWDYGKTNGPKFIKDGRLYEIDYNYHNKDIPEGIYYKSSDIIPSAEDLKKYPPKNGRYFGDEGTEDFIGDKSIYSSKDEKVLTPEEYKDAHKQFLIETSRKKYELHPVDYEQMFKQTHFGNNENKYGGRIGWLHSHNGEEPVLDSAKTLDTSRGKGGNINNTYMKKIKRKNGDFTAEGFQYQDGGQVNVPYLLKAPLSSLGTPIIPGGYQQGGQVNESYLLNAPLSHLGTPIIPGHMGKGGKVSKQSGFFPQNDMGDPNAIYNAHRQQDSTQYAEALRNNPAMARWLQAQYQQLPAEQGQPALNAFDAAQRTYNQQLPPYNTQGPFNPNQYQMGGMMDNDGDIDMMKNGGHWIPKHMHKGRCTPLGKPGCPPGSPQYNLAVTFKKHHGFHKKQMGGPLDEYAPGGMVDDFDPNSPMVPGGQGSTLPASGTMPTPSVGYAQPQTGLYQQETTNTPLPEGVDPNAQWRAGMTNEQAQDNINAGTPQQSTAGNGRNKLRAYGQGFNDLLGAGLATASFFEDQRNQRNMKGYQRQQGMSDNVFGAQKMNTAGLKGDYTSNESYFRPNQNTVSKAGMYYPGMEYGGNTLDSYVADIPDKEIKRLQKLGYKIDRI